MSSSRKETNRCWVETQADGSCSTQTREVRLPSNAGEAVGPLPDRLTLCPRHLNEMNECGIRRFFDLHPYFPAGNMGAADFSPDSLFDRHLTFLDPGVLEGVANIRGEITGSSCYGEAPGFEDLREVHIDLEEISLTDRQLMAVCLVFYGGIKKKRAAQAMKISAQALSDHVKAALNKIRSCLVQC